MEYFASLFIGPKVIMLDHTVVICYEMLDHSWIYDTDRGPEFKSASLPLDPVFVSGGPRFKSSILCN